MAFIPHSAVQRFLEAFLTWIEGLNFWASAELIIVTCVACTHIHTRVVRSTFVLCSGHVSVCIVSRVADSYAVGLLFMLPGTPWNLAAGTHCHLCLRMAMVRSRGSRVPSTDCPIRLSFRHLVWHSLCPHRGQPRRLQRIHPWTQCVSYTALTIAFSYLLYHRTLPGSRAAAVDLAVVVRFNWHRSL